MSTSKRFLVHAFIISDNNGRFLVDIVRNPKIETEHLSSFIGALKIFGEETLGKIRDIQINGLDINLMIVAKYNLISIVILDSDLPELNMRDGCEKILDAFNKFFKDKVENWNGALEEFRDFRILMDGLVQHFFELLTEYKKEHKIELEAKGRKRGDTVTKSFDSLKEQLSEYNKKFFKPDTE